MKKARFLLSGTLVGILSFLNLGECFALIDYTENANVNPRNAGARSLNPKKNNKVPKKIINQVKGSVRTKSSDISKKHIELSFTYESIGVSLNKRVGKGQLFFLKGTLRTDYNIFLSFSYLQAQSLDFRKKDNWESGNRKFILGLNWLRFGTGNDAAIVDLYGGLDIGQNDSLFITSRTDKIFGIRTMKKLFNIVIGLSYEIYLTGVPENRSEMMIGDISRLIFSLGWIVSPDIRISLEANTYDISSVSNVDVEYALREDQKFSSISSKIDLSFNSMIGFDIGAIFRTRRLKQDKLLSARLWNYAGSYGNSVYSGLWVHF